MTIGVSVRYWGMLLAAVAVSGSLWAQEAAKPAVTITPEMRGDIQMARKQFREAIDSYKSIQPPTPTSVNKIGIAYHQMGELKLARKHYESAIKLKKDYAEAYNNLGTVYYSMKNQRKAIKQYQKALRMTPTSASIHSNLGTAYFARKQYQKAMLEYQTALRLDPLVFDRQSAAGTLLQERSVDDRAMFHYMMSKMYATNGVVELALQYMRKAIEEGFKDRQKFVEEPEFAILKDNAEYKELVTLQPRIL